MKVKKIFAYAVISFITMMFSNLFLKFKYTSITSAPIYFTNFNLFLVSFYLLFILIISSWFIKERSSKNLKTLRYFVWIATTIIIVTTYLLWNLKDYEWKWISLAQLIPLIFELIAITTNLIVIDVLKIKTSYAKSLEIKSEVFLLDFLEVFNKIISKIFLTKLFLNSFLKKYKEKENTICIIKTEQLKTQKVLVVNP